MGKKSADSKTSQSTTITTTTNVRDIGLTGPAAVEAIAILEQGAVDRERIASERLNQIATTVGQTYQALVGGGGSPLVVAGEVEPGIPIRVPLASAAAGGSSGAPPLFLLAATAATAWWAFR